MIFQIFVMLCADGNARLSLFDCELIRLNGSLGPKPVCFASLYNDELPLLRCTHLDSSPSYPRLAPIPRCTASRKLSLLRGDHRLPLDHAVALAVARGGERRGDGN